MVQYMDNKNSGFNQWMANQQKKSTGDKKTSKFSGFFWWLAIFFLAWWLFSGWLSPKVEPETKTNESIASAVDISNVPVENINGDKITARVQGLQISQIQLQDYNQDKKDDARVSLLSGDGEYVRVGMAATGTTAPTADTVWKDDNGVMVWRNADKVEFRRHVIAENYILVIRDEIINNGARDVSFAPYAQMTHGDNTKNVAVSTGAIAYVNSDIERTDWKRMDKKAFAYQTTNGFIGFADQYWQTVVDIASPDQTMRIKKSDAKYRADVVAAPVHVAAGKSATIETKIFAGPRDQNILNDAAKSINGINKTMDYGWFWFLSRPMSWSLNAIHGFVLNYGVAIILLTIILRLLMWPLTRKSYTSMAAMQKMQPEMARIQKLYANDKARQQMELMKLYQSHKTSPMSGCLPMLIQIPIFFALYKALLISVPMRMAGFLWISDLSVMDPYFILPVLMGATMFWQQNLQSGARGATGAATNDPMAQTQKFMKWMPIIFTFMFAWMPAGLVLYWSVSNIFGIAQMYVIKKNNK